MWFAASLLFRSTHVPSEANPTLWEESIVLIWADNEESARKEADRIGAGRTNTYAVEGGLVVWNLEAIERIFAIQDDTLSSGCELFSRFLRDSEVKSLLTPFKE